MATGYYDWSMAVSDDIDTITEPYSRYHDFAYSGNKVSTFTDYASHTTTLAYTSGKLTSVTPCKSRRRGSRLGLRL